MRFKTPVFFSGVVAAVAVVALPATASAAPQVAAVETPLAAPVDPARTAAVAVGEGTVVWAERDAVGSATLALRTRDASGPRTITQLTGIEPGTGPELEVGRTADGSAVVAVTVRNEARTTVELVRVSDGRRQALSNRLRGGSLRGVGVDHGWIYATRTTGSVAKRKSTLWRARITGLDVGAYTRIRSADRTEEWSRVAADRNRVAVLTTRPFKRDGAFAEESWLAGTPRGKLIRTSRNYATDGGYQPLLVAGFTADRSAVITVRRTDYAPAPATVQRVPLAGRGATRTIQVVAPMLTDGEAIGYDGNDDRLVAVGPDAAGTPSLGTAPAPWGPSGR